ncbi:MAG: hypothetical protein KGV44_03955 [Flavobacteriaceae bacterium]|nr:hypothetical protein [Flavobacteriaceae bacterium]
MIRSIAQFSVYLLLLLSGIFAIHFYSCYDSFTSLNQHRILFAYLGNYSLTITIYGVLLLLEKKYNHLLGFFFMGGSLLKMAFFFVFFHHFYRADGKIELLEILSFLIPYGVCLVFETMSLIKKVNK